MPSAYVPVPWAFAPHLFVAASDFVELAAAAGWCLLWHLYLHIADSVVVSMELLYRNRMDSLPI